MPESLELHLSEDLPRFAASQVDPRYASALTSGGPAVEPTTFGPSEEVLLKALKALKKS